MSTDDKTIQYYKDKAKEYASHVRNSEDSIYHAYYEKPAMYALLPELENKKVLSLGCGSGEDSFYLKKQGANKSVGIDLSEELINIAKKSYSECEFFVMNMEKINFPDSSFDFIYSSLAIHYLEDWNKVFKEVYRLLKPGSSFLFSCGHPVRLAMAQKDDKEYFIKKLEVVKEKATGKVEVTGDYLAKKKIIDSMGENTVNIWSMPLGDIAEAATEAGFLIEKMIEPRPLEKLKTIKSQTYYRLNKIPEFVIFKLKK
ncbi:MAG: class I SAM-dependent methyltransferase [Patescibacteria group bacterium]